MIKLQQPEKGYILKLRRHNSPVQIRRTFLNKVSMKEIFGLLLLVFLSLPVFADNYSLTQKEQQLIFEEAENWIDDMPEGIGDRLSDAINHATHGFYNEVEYFRNMADTTGIGKYSVRVKDINGGNGQDIPMRIYESSSSKDSPLLIYFHGGGWSLGSIKVSDKFCRALASMGKVKVVSVEYPLAPEKPYPSAVIKCVDAVKYIFNKSSEWGFSTNNISLGGDGAGGNIALETYSRLPSNNKIQSLVLYYPLLETTGRLDPSSKREYGRGYGFDSRLWESFINAYNGNDPKYPDLLPPTLIIGAGRDIIIDEVKNFGLSSPEIKYIEFEGAIHGFITDGHQTSAFKKAVELTDLFLTK